MFCKNNTQQFSLNDPLITMPKYLKEILAKGWAHLFQEYIFPNINEERFSVLYSDNPATRPNSPVNILIALLILKELFNHTDEELIGSLHFDMRYQYAVRTTSFERQPVSVNTLYNFRKRLYDYEQATGIDLLQQEVEEQAKLIAKYLEVDSKKVRMDSFMVSSSSKKLSRIELIYTVNARVVKSLDKIDPKIIPSECKAYLEKGHKNATVYRTRDQEAESKLEFLLRHSQDLYNAGLKAGEHVTTTEEFQHLERMLKEQLKQDEAGKQIPKKGSEISSESLQNPTDPDATYRKKYGDNIGYVANVVEAMDDENSVIIHYDLKPNTYSDSAFADDVIEKLTQELHEEENRRQVLIDGAYYEQEKAEKASDKGIDLIPGELVGRKPNEEKISYAQFSVNEDENRVEQCPSGKTPIDSSYNEKNNSYTAKFDKEHCNNCSKRKNCPVKDQKKNTVVRFTKKRYKTDQQRIRMKEQEYIELTNQRAGVEGIPSVFRRTYAIDHMPVRGLVRSKFWFGAKILAYNTKKLLKKGLSLGKRYFFACYKAFNRHDIQVNMYFIFEK